MQRAALFLALSAHALAASSMDLLQIYRDARSSDAIYRSAQEAYKADLEKLPQARSLLLPKVDLSANTMGNDVSLQYQGSNIFESGASRFNSKGYVLSLTQPLFRLDNWVTYTEAEFKVTLADARYRMASQDLILRASRAYSVSRHGRSRKRARQCGHSDQTSLPGRGRRHCQGESA